MQTIHAKMLRKAQGILLVLVSLLFCASAHAQLTLTLTPSTQFNPPNTISYFSGTIQNTSASFVLLNDIVFDFGGQPLTFNDANTFFNNVPGVFAPAGDAGGGDMYTGLIFDATATESGEFSGTVQLVGDPDGADTNLLLALSEPTPFTVNSTPEPGSLALLGTGIVSGMLLLRRRKRHISH